MDRKTFSNLTAVVADEPYMASLTASMLRQLGARNIIEVPDLRGLETAAARHELGLVLVDDSIGPGDPVAFVRTLRANTQSWNRYVPILMTFSAADKGRILAARDAGVTEFLRKPLSPKIIELRLVQALDHPRPFVEAPTYLGPDRRRRSAHIAGPDRRRA